MCKEFRYARTEYYLSVCGDEERAECPAEREVRFSGGGVRWRGGVRL